MAGDRWEYLTVIAEPASRGQRWFAFGPPFQGKVPIPEAFNQLGENGWEAVGMIPLTFEGTSDGAWCLFKRWRQPPQAIDPG